jgi:hypothetical protein
VALFGWKFADQFYSRGALSIDQSTRARSTFQPPHGHHIYPSWEPGTALRNQSWIQSVVGFHSDRNWQPYCHGGTEPESNHLSGPLPSELGNLESLKILSLANNRITGSIPSSLGRYRSLEEARWNNNLLTGAIPSQLGLWNGILSIWDVSNNMLSGSLAVELSTWWTNNTGGSVSLAFFNVSGNEGLIGTIPAGLCETLNYSFLGFDCNDLLCGCDCRCQNGSMSSEGSAL